MEQAVTQTSTFAIIKHASYILAFVAGATGLPHDSLAILAMLMVLDTITGVIRVGVVNGPRAIKSSIGIAGIITKLVVWTVPAIVAVTGKGSGIDLYPLANGALSMLIIAEGYSVLGNIYSIRTKTEKQEWDAVAWALGTVRTAVERVLKGASHNMEENYKPKQ